MDSVNDYIKWEIIFIIFCVSTLGMYILYGFAKSQGWITGDVVNILIGAAVDLGYVGGAIGSTLGCLITCRAGVSMLSEDIKQARNVIILAALPITQTMYGAIFAIFISTTVMPKAAVIKPMAAMGIFGVGIIAFILELFSAWWQGVVCAQAISLLSKTNGQITTSSLVLAAYLEFMGILGMVFGIAISSLLIMV